MTEEKLNNTIDSLYKTGNCELIKTENNIATVNGVPLCFYDFGTLIYSKPVDIERPKFEPKPSTIDVLNKYGITEEEYQLIFKIMEYYMGAANES